MNFNNKSILDMNEDLDKIEKQIITPEIYDDERLSLEENILKQKVMITACVLLTCYAVFPGTLLVSSIRPQNYRKKSSEKSEILLKTYIYVIC